MPSKFRSTSSLALKIAVAVGLIAYLMRSGHLDFKIVLGMMTVANVVIAVVLVGLNISFSTWRWIILLKARGFHIAIRSGFALYLIGMFFSYALPGSVSGDLVRGYYLVQDYPNRKMDGVLSVLIDRVLGLYSFFILTLAAVVWDWDLVMSHDKIRWVAALTFFIFLGLTLFFILAFSTRIYQASHLEFIIRRIGPLQKLMEGFRRFGKDRKTILASVAVSLLAQIFTMIFFYGIGVLINEPGVTWNSVLFAVPMGFVVTAIPIAPAGVGVGQVAFLYLFQTYMGKQSQYGAIAITAFQLSMAVWALSGVFFYLRRRKPVDLENFETEMETA